MELPACYSLRLYGLYYYRARHDAAAPYLTLSYLTLPAKTEDPSGPTTPVSIQSLYDVPSWVKGKSHQRFVSFDVGVVHAPRGGGYM